MDVLLSVKECKKYEFSSPDELLEWVNTNTDLKAENGDFKIEGQYLPYNL